MLILHSDHVFEPGGIDGKLNMCKQCLHGRENHLELLPRSDIVAVIEAYLLKPAQPESKVE